MLNELITWILNTYLGKYLEDFNPDQLSVALISGEVELENVPIRKDALRSFGVPVQTLSGSIGRIKLQIPVRQFRTSPWSIIIERVYAVFGPKDVCNWDNDLEKEADYNYKIKELNGLETNWRIDNGCHSDNFYSLSYSSWINYGTSIITNVLENLELRIYDVHLRYEDTLDFPLSPIAAGIRIKSFIAQTCDSNWIPCAKNLNLKDISFKLLELTELNIYWDKLNPNNKCSTLNSKELSGIMNKKCPSSSHQFITSPINATAKFKRELCKQPLRTKSRPRLACEFVLPEVNIYITDIQYSEIRSCLSGLQHIRKICEFRLMRPISPVSSGARVWWQYVAKCNGFTCLSSEEKWRLAKENLRYISICRRLLLNPSENIGTEEKRLKSDIEKNRSLQDLKMLRKICFESISINEINRGTIQGKGILYHWFPNWLGWYRSDENTNMCDQSQIKDEETYKNIENDILTALKETIENDSFSKRDVVFGNITFVLSSGRIYLLSSKFGKTVASVNMDLENIFCFINVKPKLTSYCIGISLGSVSLKDNLTESTEYPYLIKPQEKENQKNIEPLIFLPLKQSECLDKHPWFHLEYEKNPSDHESEFSLVIKSKNIDIIYNETVFKWLVSFFREPSQRFEQDITQNMDKSRQIPFFKNWKNVILGHKDKQKKWSFEIDISAPRVIFVENFQHQNGSLVLIDFGRFQLLKNDVSSSSEHNINAATKESDSGDDLFMTPCSTPPGSQTSMTDSAIIYGENLLTHDKHFPRIFINRNTGLEHKLCYDIYEKYTINLTDLQVFLCKRRNYALTYSKASSSFHLLDKFSISLYLERRIINAVDQDYPFLKLNGSLSKIVAHINEQKLSECLRIVSPIKLDFFTNAKNLESVSKEKYKELELSNTTFFQFVIGQIILEIQSAAKSIAEIQVLGTKANITKQNNQLNIIMSVHGFLLVDAIQSFGPDFELLIASHRHIKMDCVSGILNRNQNGSTMSHTSPEVDTFISQQFIKKSIMFTDVEECSGTNKALISIDLQFINSTDGAEKLKLAHIIFNNLDVIANQETILELLDFGKRVLDHCIQHLNIKTNAPKTISLVTDGFCSTTQPNPEINFDFHRLNILLLRKIRIENINICRKVGMLTLYETKISATFGKSIHVAGILGGIKIIDVTSDNPNHRLIFSVGKCQSDDKQCSDEANDNKESDDEDSGHAFTFKLHQREEPGHAIKIRMASVFYTHCPLFIDEISLSVKEFVMDLKGFLISMSNKASFMAMGLVQTVIKDSETEKRSNFGENSFDIILNSPVLVLPASDKGNKVLVANLGMITVSNSHETLICNEVIEDKNLYSLKRDVYIFDVKNINLYSLKTVKVEEIANLLLSKNEERYSYRSGFIPILHNTAMLFRCIYERKPIKLNTGWEFNYKTMIEGRVTQNLHISLSRVQYKQLIESVRYATNISIIKESHIQDEKKTDVVEETKTSLISKNIEAEFSVPILKMDLKNENNLSFMHLTFKEFCITKKEVNQRIEFQVFLRSILLEDLKCKSISKFRNMVNSSCDIEKLNQIVENKASMSCPDISKLDYLYGSTLFSSVPHNLHAQQENQIASDGKPKILKIKNFSKYDTKVAKETLVIYRYVIEKTTTQNTHISSSIDFNCLNLIISTDKWLMVLEFFGLITNTIEKENLPVGKHSHQDNLNLVQEHDVSIRSLNLILVRDESELAKANVSNFSLHLVKETFVQYIEGKLGSLSVYDLTPYGSTYPQRLFTTGTEALSFVYKRLQSPLDYNREKNHTLDNDAFLIIRMTSVQYIHTKRFLMEFQMFIKELLQLQQPVMSRLMINTSGASTNQIEIYTKVGLDINAESPIILFPAAYNCNHVLIADLGKFSLKNYFQYSHEANFLTSSQRESTQNAQIIECMKIELANMNLTSGERKSQTLLETIKDSKKTVSIGNSVLITLGETFIEERCHLNIEILRITNANKHHYIPDFQIKVNISEFKALLNTHQYKLLRALLNFNLGEVIDDVYYNYQVNINKSLERLCTIMKESTCKSVLPVWNILSINFILENVTISLSESLLKDKNLAKPFNSNLAHIKFIKSTLTIDMFSDGSHDIDLICTEILVIDARNGDWEYSNSFKHILKPSVDAEKENVVQIEIHCRKKNDTVKYTILLNNMRIMALLDFLNSLKNFIKEEPFMCSEIKNKNPNTNFFLKKRKSQKSPCPDDIVKFELLLNITNSEIVFIENCEKFDSSAIVLKSTTIFSYKPHSNFIPVSVDINDLEIFSCILGSESVSSLSIIDPFSLNIELRNDCLHVLIPNSVFLRISYNDAILFSKMLQSFPCQVRDELIKNSQACNFDKIAPLAAMGFNENECLTAMQINENNLNEAAIWLSHMNTKSCTTSTKVSSISLNASSISVCVIDDCLDADVPLLEICLSRVLINHKLGKLSECSTTRCNEGEIEAAISSNYYNRRLSGWEPIIEAWECTSSWKYLWNIFEHNKRLNVVISSKQILKFNITSSLIELCKLVRKNWIKEFYERSIELKNINTTQIRQRLPFVPFALKNMTGEPLLFKIYYSQAGGITRTEVTEHDLISNWISANHGEVIPFDFGPQSKWRHSDSHKLNMHQILLQIHGWTLIGPVSIDKVGTFFRYSNLDTKYSKKTRIVFEIELVGSAQKQITVRSAVNIFNHTQQSFVLHMVLRNENEKQMVLLQPVKHITVPLRFVDSLIYLKPQFESYTPYNLKSAQLEENYEKNSDENDSAGVCTKAISWLDCNSKDVTHNMHSCFFPNKIPFHVLSVIKKDNFPTRDIGIMPGHTISILPPLRLKNLLCCDLLYKVSEHTHGRINSFDEIEIFSVDVSDAFCLYISLDNYKLSGRLKIPMNHIGVVDLKLKLIDILNRELSLRVSIQSSHGRSMEIYISAPIWIINRTGLPLLFRQEGTSQPSSGQFEEHEHAREVSPLMFSFSDHEGSTMLEFRLGKSYGANNPWCKCVGLHKYTTFRELKAEKTNINYVVGVNVSRGKGLNSYTTFITLSPRFQLYNRSTKKLQFAQKCDIMKEIPTNHIITALPGCNFPFHWSNCEQEPLLCVRIDDGMYHHWSCGLPVNEAKSVFINLRNDFGEMFFLRLEVIVNGGTYLLHLTDAYSLPPPIRLDNYSEVNISFSQKGVEPFWRTNVKCQSSLAYVLDDPLGTQILRIEAPGGNLIEFPLRSNNDSKCITYANFIYLAFKDTFGINKSDQDDENVGDKTQELVLAVKDKFVIITKKCAGDRSQLWLMNSFGQIEHEGSSPPAEYSKNSQISPRLVLDLEKPPNPTKYTRLVVRPQNNQRITTQTWRFENGRLMCHANMCVQAYNGLINGGYAVLGKIYARDSEVPIEQSIEIQKLRPGSGHLEISSKMDGPIKSIQIVDVKSNSDNIFIMNDPLWKHASIFNKCHLNSPEIYGLDEITVNLELLKGLGLSLITRSPCEELAYITLEGITLETAIFRHAKLVNLKVTEIQIDNQLLETTCPITLYISKKEPNAEYEDALKVNVKMLPSPNKNAVIFEYILAYLKPCIIFLEERLILKMALFLNDGYNIKKKTLNTEWQTFRNNDSPFSQKLRRFYFENLLLGPTQVRLTVLTAPKLTNELLEIKKMLGLTLIKLEDALIEFEKYKDQHHFETSEIYLKSIKNHYINQLKWHAASILGSVDFLGNPLGFANDLSEGVSGLIFEGSLKSLVKNVTHGISNSTAKLTETLSDSLGRVVLDEHDNETRQKILEISYPTTGNHLAAGLKGFGFGLLGGVTSIVRQTYVGTQTDGFPGFFSGLGKGLVGTVTKPLIGVLDLASETANAVRETSRGSRRCLPNRKRLPRCVTGAPGGLLPYYSYRQSKGQQYLYVINKRNFAEKLIFYEPNLCNDKETQLRLLISTEFVRIFSRCDHDPAIMIECHLREILSCHPITTNTSSLNPNKVVPCFYIEISTNLPKVTRPRVRCQNEEIAERASRFVNYAKTIFDEREHSLVNN